MCPDWSAILVDEQRVIASRVSEVRRTRASIVFAEVLAKQGVLLDEVVVTSRFDDHNWNGV